MIRLVGTSRIWPPPAECIDCGRLSVAGTYRVGGATHLTSHSLNVAATPDLRMPPIVACPVR